METVQTFGTLPVLEAEREREVQNGFGAFQDEEYETDWAAWNLRNALDAEDDPILLPCYDYDEQGYLISDGLTMAEHERVQEKKRANSAEIRAEREAAGRRAERQRAEAAEAEIARLRAELEALRKSA